MVSKQNDMWRHLLFLCETMPHSYLNILEKTVNVSWPLDIIPGFSVRWSFLTDRWNDIL